MAPPVFVLTLMAWFFGVVRRALARKCKRRNARGTHEDSSDVSDDALVGAPANEASHFQKVKRKRKDKCLLFFESATTTAELLVWVCIAEHIMHIHYSLFNSGSWYGHLPEDRRLGIFQFCSDLSDNPGATALTALALMLFAPNAQGRRHLRPLLTCFGGAATWPEDLVAAVQGALILVFCSIWRHLVHAFRRYPWLLVPALDEAKPMCERKAAMRQLFAVAGCCLDPFFCEPLRARLCPFMRDDIFDSTLGKFLMCMFKRVVVTSTFNERLFALLTEVTSDRTMALSTLAATMCNTTFARGAERWRRDAAARRGTGNAQKNAGKCRAPWVKAFHKGAGTTGLHVFSEQWTKEHGFHPRECGDAWKQELPEQKNSYRREALKRRKAAKGKEAPLEAVEREQAERCHATGGCWNLAAASGDCPLDLGHILAVTGTRRAFDTAVQAWTADAGTLTKAHGDFPRTVECREACFAGECIHGLRPEQLEVFHRMKRLTRIACRFYEGPKQNKFQFFEYRSACGTHTHRALLAQVQGTYALEAEFLTLKPPRPPARECPFELILDTDDAYAHHMASWPVIETQDSFFIKLARQDANLWSMFSLQAETDEMHSFIVRSVEAIDYTLLEEKEEGRLARKAALLLLKKIHGQGPDPRPRAPRRRGPPRKRVPEGTSSSESSSTDVTSDGQRLDLPPPEPHPEARPESKRKAKKGDRWGSGKWEIALIEPRGQGVTGVGARCLEHHNPDDNKECKKHVTIGTSGLDVATLTLRLKRWLVAGLDDEHWDERKQAKHVSMGGQFCKEFEHGLGPDALDRIANSR